ncbi:hypothetical protein R1sor_006494 [Riccia sorocarpa]|uniref:MULE transposase domain-containing protein n=1 Tax=Riccia sorocarpa TaxID=122646 RepID=A0ABD3HN64_9MARC
MCNFCHIRIERRAVQAVPEEGESDEEFEEDESSKSRNLECEYVHLVEEMRDLFEEEESSRGTVIAYCKVTLQEEILKEVLRSENEKVVGVVNVKVCIEKKEMELTLTHLCPHPKPEYKGDAVPKATLRRIEEMADTNIRRGDVYRMLCLEGLIDPERIRRAQVNFWMAEKLAKLYVRNTDNQLLSSKQLIECSEFQSKGFEVVFYGDTATLAAISFVTPFWGRVSSVKEIVINNTFKTKSLRFELFCISANVGGIGGIEETFPNTYVQMCLWHAQRAVELQIQLLDSPIRPYDAAGAHAVHNFIDDTWIPESLLQRDHICPVDSKKSVLVHDWTGEEFHAIDDPPDTEDVTYDYLENFKEKWLKLVQNTKYLVEKEHDNEKFIEAFDKALYSFDRAIGQCMTALRSGLQQQTWAKMGPSMWLR